MSIVRIQHDKDRPYVQINKKFLENPNLSWAAKGLLSYLISRPDNWRVSVSHLSKIYNGKGGGEKAIYTILKELKEQGYCEYIQDKAEKGHYAKVEYVISEFQKILPQPSQRDAVEGDAVKRGTNKERKEIKKERNKDVQRITKNPPPNPLIVDRDSSFDLESNSFSDEEKELSDNITRLGKLVFLDNIPIKSITVMRWLLKYSFEDTDKALKYYFKFAKLGKNKIKNHEAYVETILKNRYWEIQSEKDYVEENISKHEKRKKEDEEYWNIKRNADRQT